MATTSESSVGSASYTGMSDRGGGQTSTASRGMFSALRFRNYRLFWLGQIVSVTGPFLQGTAQQWLVLQLFGADYVGLPPGARVSIAAVPQTISP